MDMISLEATALGGTNSMLVGVDSNCRHIHVKFLKNGSKVVLQPDWKRRDMNAVTSSVQCPVPGGPWIHGFRPYYQGEIIWGGKRGVSGFPGFRADAGNTG